MIPIFWFSIFFGVYIHYDKLLFYSVISNYLSSYFTWLNKEDPHCFGCKELNLFVTDIGCS